MLIKLAADAVIELLLVYAQERMQQVTKEENKLKWETIIDFLLDARKTGLPL